MLETTTRPSKSHPLPIEFVPRTSFKARMTNRLERGNFSRDARLLDASIAGVVLSFNPRDDEMREKAESSWETIRALLAKHLFGQEAAVLPWNGDASVGSPAALDIIKKRYAELRSLVLVVDSVSFEKGSDAEISNAGRALCRLAVKLDDLMEGTQRRLVNKLRQYVLSSPEEMRLSA
jgi:hypothetical protein